MKPNKRPTEGEPAWMRWAHKARKRRCRALKCRERQGNQDSSFPEAYLGLQRAYEAELRRHAAPVELDSLGRLCDAAWAALCEARRAM